MHWLKVGGKWMSHMQTRLRSVIWAALSVVSHALSFTASNHLEGIPWHVIPAETNASKLCMPDGFFTTRNLPRDPWQMSVREAPPTMNWGSSQSSCRKREFRGAETGKRQPKDICFNKSRLHKISSAKNERSSSFCNKPVWLIKNFLFVYLFWIFSTK